MSVYVVLSSDKSLQYFPSNTSYKFSCHLNAPLILEGKWKVALVEAYVSSSYSKSNMLYLSSSICEESIIEGEKKPLLRRLTAYSPGQWNTVFESGFYVPVKHKEIYDIDVNITTESEQLASFLDQTSSITLHFKAFPFH